MGFRHRATSVQRACAFRLFIRPMIPRRAVPLLVGCLLLAGVLIALFAAGGYPIMRSVSAMWDGSVGTWYSFSSATLVRAIPLMLTGCGVAIAFRAGVFNVGAEGQFLAGATSATAVALTFAHGGYIGTLAALIAGAVAGSLWAGIAAVLRAAFGVLEVISTIMLNFVALYAVSFLVRGPMQEPRHVYPQTSVIAEGVRLARVPGAGRLHVGLFIALAVLVLCGWIFRHTAAGFRLLVAGENPAAARSAGQIDVVRTTTVAFLYSGALAGIAGATQVLGVTFALYENISPGYGYTAIAVALLARLDPWLVIFSAMMFGALEAGAGAMQRDAGVPSALVTVVEALLILGVIAAQAPRWRSVLADSADSLPDGDT